MREAVTILLPVVLPVLAGILLLAAKEPERKGVIIWYTGAVLVATAVLVAVCVVSVNVPVTFFYLLDQVPVCFAPDHMGKVFALVVTLVWVPAGFFSFSYLKEGKKQKRFYGFYLIVYGILNALNFAGNLVTFYVFYELMTLLSMPLVLHEQTREAVMAGVKYLFYSFCGAYMALFGLYVVWHHSGTFVFTERGTLDPSLVSGNEGILLLAACFLLLGFSVKAGMFPMHGWLPVAHPVAPAPASAVLSGLIVKGGVLGMIRVIFYTFGADFLRGSWVQTLFLTLALITVFMGSMLAYLEKGLKKRLAYSTVSQVSYILFGLFLLAPAGLTGSLLHVIFHACIKSCLFLCAGAVIRQTGKQCVDELTGIGKEMPVTMWCFAICSLALIGIPPACAFISQWYLCVGAFDAGIPVVSWLGPVVLLVSALLTAGYLLPIVIRGFFPGQDYDYAVCKRREGSAFLVVPVVFLAAIALVGGMVTGGLTGYLSDLAGQLL